jgi:hypothetical protein
VARLVARARETYKDFYTEIMTARSRKGVMLHPPQLLTILVVLWCSGHNGQPLLHRLYYRSHANNPPAAIFGFSHPYFISEFLSFNMRRWGCVSFIIASSYISSSGPLIQRSAGEHVILANCIDNTGVKSSQMAYFSGSPGPSPSSVATVSTTYGQTRVWEYAVTSATFPDGDTFTANISGVASQGDYAYNDYGPFTCWSNYVPNLYKWAANTCTEVYDCNHSPGKTAFLILASFQQR